MIKLTLKVPNIIIYTKTGCASCAVLKKLLKDSEITYREIDTDREENYLEMARISGQQEQVREAYTSATLIRDQKWQGDCFIGYKKTSKEIKKLLGL